MIWPREGGCEGKQNKTGCEKCRHDLTQGYGYRKEEKMRETSTYQ